MIDSREKYDPDEARARAEAFRADPRVQEWMRRAERLFKALPPSTWIYWQEDCMNLMVRGPRGETYVATRSLAGGNAQEAVIDNVHVPGSDAGAW